MTGARATATTVTGTRFEYSGSLSEGLTLYFSSGHRTRVSTDTIAIVRREITRRSPVAMGANRSPLVRDSVGETLQRDHGVSPQVLSYVLPLLIEEGFCTATRSKPEIITKRA